MSVFVPAAPVILQRRGVFGPGGFAPVDSIDWTSSTSIPAWATFTATGLATQFDSTGKLTYRPNNLLTQSNNFSNAAWIKTAASVTANATSDPVGGNNAWKLVESATTAWHWIGQAPSTLPSGVNGWQFIYAKAAERSILGVDFSASVDHYTYFDLSNGTVASNPGGNTTYINPVVGFPGWYLVGVKRQNDNASTNFVFFPTTAAGTTSYAGDGSSGIYIYAAGVSAVTYETSPRAADQVITTSAAYYGPRFDYTYNGSSWVPAGLLIEPVAATNIIPQSAMVSGWSTATNAAFTSGVSAPDGSANMRLLAPSSTTSAAFYAYNSTSSAAVTVYSASFFVSNAGQRYAQIISGTGSNYANFDLQSGIIGTTNATSSAIQNLGGGLYRITMVGTFGLNTAIGLALSNSASATYAPSFAGTAGVGINVWGAQVETGSVATTYIPTGASAVTRAAESLVYSGYASNPFAILSAPESTGAFACNKYADQATANAAIAAANQWIKSVKIWPVGTPSGSQTC